MPELHTTTATPDDVCYNLRDAFSIKYSITRIFGGVAQLVERRSLAGELSLSCARPAADG